MTAQTKTERIGWWIILMICAVFACWILLLLTSCSTGDRLNYVGPLIAQTNEFQVVDGLALKPHTQDGPSSPVVLSPLDARPVVLSRAQGAASVIVVPPPRPVVARFEWPALVGATNYTLWWGVRAHNYTNSLSVGRNLSGAISNLVSAQNYYVTLTAQNSSGVQSDFTPEIVWPVRANNYVGIEMQTNGGPFLFLLYTNPPGDVVIFTTKIWQTNNDVRVIRLDTGGLLVANTN